MKKALSRKNLWEKTPQPIKSTLGLGLGLIPLKFLLGKKFRANCGFVEEAQWWPAQRAKEYQFVRLREILKLAYEDTEYYQNLFKSIGFRPSDLHSPDDMVRIPTIDKDVILRNTIQMCAQNLKAREVEYTSTAGTSGTPLQFYTSVDRSATEYSYLVAGWKRVGYKLNIPMTVLRGRLVQTNRAGFLHEYDPILRHHYYSSFHMSDGNMKEYLTHISTVGPCFLHVYPSTIAALSRYILRSGTEAPKNILGILAESEIVYTEQRKLVEEVFDCRYFSSYGQTEKVVLATGCAHSNDYHVWPTYGYFELLDDNGNQVTKPGERGEIVGTSFINTVMPFIRYRTGDTAVYVGDRCDACGREHMLIRDVRGHRTQEVLVAADNTEIPWVALNMHDDTFNRVRRFQFFQDEPGRAVMRVVPAGGFDQDDLNRIKRNLGRKFDNKLEFSIELVDKIPLSKAGKAIYVDQRIQRTAGIEQNTSQVN